MNIRLRLLLVIILLMSLVGGCRSEVEKPESTDHDECWVCTWGDDYTNQSFDGMAVDESGSVYICGDFFGRVDYDPGPWRDIQGPLNRRKGALIKVDSGGNYVWGHQMPITLGGGYGHVVVNSEGYVYLLCEFDEGGDFDDDGAVHAP